MTDTPTSVGIPVNNAGVQVCDSRIGVPFNNDVSATLTDMYQITMAYAYFTANKHQTPSAFELFFRQAPFKGIYTILAGVDDCMRFLNTFRFSEGELSFIRKLLPKHKNEEERVDEFIDYLRSIDGSAVQMYAIAEGSVVFPHIPVVRVEGPLAVCQLLETTLLTLLNFASLIATNAGRYRIAAGFDKVLMEFGLRRAQGPDGGMTASRFSYMGGFDSTSNVRASMLFGIPCSGTHAHAFVTAFQSMDQAQDDCIGAGFVDLVKTTKGEVLETLDRLRIPHNTQEGELAAFTNYANAFPHAFLALVDTYDVTLSGVINFLIVAIAIKRFGEINKTQFSPKGIRLDSGDLAYLSTRCRSIIDTVASAFDYDFSSVVICVSNNIDEGVLHAFKDQHHNINAFGIGTNLVTCSDQPALGMVFKLVDIDGEPVLKISEDIEKSTLPARKELYRLFDAEDRPILDFFDSVGKPAPEPMQRVYCQHPVHQQRRCCVIPSRVEKLLNLVWDKGVATDQFMVDHSGYGADSSDTDSISVQSSPSTYLQTCRDRALASLKLLREDQMRLMNPTPYKISTSKNYADYFQEVWAKKAPLRCYL